MRYSIRNVPDHLDAALRRLAKEQGKSLSQATVEALARGIGLGDQRIRRRDLSYMTENWEEDPVFDAAIADQDKVDGEMWQRMHHRK
jgi:hypothetical protein